MLKSFRAKITAINIFLIIGIAFVGAISMIRVQYISNSIENLMSSNYKSITATINMIETVEEQNNALLSYVYNDTVTGINKFHSLTEEFYKWYNVETDNITEEGEAAYVEQIKQLYSLYLQNFSFLQEEKVSNSLDAVRDFYYNKQAKVFNELKENIKSLTDVNEEGMSKNKEKLLRYSYASMYFILFSFSSVIVISLIISLMYTKSILKPVYILKGMIRSIKEGHLVQEAPITSDDEFGELTAEFNSMTQKLYRLEQSNLGKLMAEKNKSVAIVKSISDPIIVLDNHYRVTLMNKAFENQFDVTESSSVNKYFLEAIRNSELYDFIYKISNDINESPKQKIVTITKENEELYFNVVVNVIKDSESSLNGIIVVLQNVTELKKLETMKSNFVSTVSHEFKTPLTSIIIGASLMQNNKVGELNATQLEIIETIQEDSEKLNNLVNNLLKISRLEHNKAVFDFKRERIEDIIEGCKHNFEDQASRSGIQLESYFDEETPEVLMDGEKISWVINNLISNALKFTEKDGSIYISSFVDDSKLFVRVADTGMGIPEEFVDKIFDKFIQVGNGSDKRGTGLGLAIAKEIVEAHGGEIWCESKEGEGSTFIFTLPINEES